MFWGFGDGFGDVDLWRGVDVVVCVFYVCGVD